VALIGRQLRKAVEIERGIADLAARQHGVVTRQQLLALGLSAKAIRHRLNTGRLHQLYRGVYLVGHTSAPTHAPEMAATLACGEAAVLSHRSAAHLWQLLHYSAHARLPEVTVPGRNPDARPDIRIYRVKSLDRRDVTRRLEISVVTPARALLDLAAVVSPRELELAYAEGQARRRLTRAAVEAVLARNGRRAGTGVLRALLEKDGPPSLTRSEAEERLLHLIRSSGLPHPVVNARLGPFEVDLLWRPQRLVVEVDGFQYHSSRAAFERDRLRDAELQARGYGVMRVTWRQIVDEPEAVVVRLAQALSARAA
jgi:very-short-patch-repair endonuclease